MPDAFRWRKEGEQHILLIHCKREYVGGGDSGQEFAVCNVLLDSKI